MKVYIQTDIEGVAGWVFYGSHSGSPFNLRHQERMGRLLTAEVNAAAEAAVEVGADEIYVNDNHGCCYNICVEELHPACRIIHGRSGHFPSWLPLLDDTFDAAIAIGMHAMAGTPESNCPHSYWHLTLGDGSKTALSECTMFAALAGDLGIPLVAVSGDDKIAQEVSARLPSCRTAVVKQSLGPQNVCSLAPKRAMELIRCKVTEGLRQRNAIQPFVLRGPFRLNVSDRDPSKRELEEDMHGEKLWDLMHEVCRKLGRRWGDQSFDDRSWRFPDSVFCNEK